MTVVGILLSVDMVDKGFEKMTDKLDVARSAETNNHPFVAYVKVSRLTC